jgi:hypothetical protein
MKYSLITTNEQPLVADNPSDFIKLMAQHGHEQNGVHNRPSSRIELQGQPKFKSVCGPMFNGDEGIRYESTKAYRMASF